MYGIYYVHVWYILRIRFSALAMNIGTYNISRRSYITVSWLPVLKIWNPCCVCRIVVITSTTGSNIRTDSKPSVWGVGKIKLTRKGHTDFSILFFFVRIFCLILTALISIVCSYLIFDNEETVAFVKTIRIQSVLKIWEKKSKKFLAYLILFVSHKGSVCLSQIFRTDLILRKIYY